MNLKELRELIEIVGSEPTIEEFEYERSGVRVRISRTAHRAPRQEALPGDVREGAPTPAGADETVSAAAGPPAEEEERHAIVSPMVGTFYRAPSPDSEPFVKVGDMVEKGTVVCIIEAMKLMNEIESEVAGEVVSIPVENGHPVEYGEVLAVVRPR
jgi:acetyl-CoA carboxylase biotin carboxyl carrier protein